MRGMAKRGLAYLALGSISFVIACGSSVGAPDGKLPEVSSDVGAEFGPEIGFDLADDPATDGLDVADWISDLAVDGDSGGKRRFGEACVRNLDCQSGFCIEGLQGSICTEMCTESCPVGYSCRVVLNYYPDVASLCVPDVKMLCEPCQTSEQCFGGVCVAGPDGSFCASDCSQESCPTTFTCVVAQGAEGLERSLCLPASGSCLCLPGNDGQLRTCQRSNDFGICRGWEACDPEAGWVGCNAREPVGETCDGLDDDCNALVDDALPDTQPCQHFVDGIGTCFGVERCGGDQGWVCGARVPMEEACNFVDDNCDGLTDEPFLVDGVYGLPEHCGTCNHACDGSIAFAATIRCAAELDYPECVVETCDEGYYRLNDFQCILPPDTFCKECATDLDCYGNDCLDLAGSRYCFKPCETNDECFTGYGCRTSGQVAGTYCLPDNGTCDCDASSDAYKKACSITNPIGTCYGFQTCSAGSGWTACDARSPAVETCNGLDDDCNHLQDDGLDEGTCEVIEGVGTCTGANVCFGAAGWICSARQPEVEVCNYRDDDCDGQTDEGFRDEQGDYGLYGHCGACNHACDGAVPNGSARCQVTDGVARCVVAACDPGTFAFGDEVCVKAGPSACRPCLEDVDCVVPGDRCEATPDGGYCAEDCAAGNFHLYPEGQCPEGFVCGPSDAGSHCRPLSGSCTCRADDEGKRRVCTWSNAFGTCYGGETCDPQAGWGPCDAAEPADEICNGQDDDCDGLPDDLPDLGLPCARTVSGVGSCLGVYACVDGNPTATCSAPEPLPEACNYADDDCDGATDEAFPTLYQSCAVGAGTCLRYGYVRCAADGLTAECTAKAATAGVETCDNLDDDCDGQTDEGWEGKGEPCASGSGICLRRGLLQCNAADPAGPLGCSVAAGAGADEICNGLDDDCDGQTDEGFVLDTSCVVGVGRCQALGVLHCDPGDPSGPSVCSAVPGEPSAEVCNGQDDDCDGLYDEEWPARGGVCAVGVGACARSGVLACDGADPAGPVVCTIQPGEPTPEVCNGLDDNCNGATDESWADKGDVCTTGLGVCARSGVRLCDAGDPDGPTVCGAVAGPSTFETCDALDDDCDGLTDEEWPEKGTVCEVGQGACHRTGVWICDGANPGGPALCDVAPGTPKVELCNGLDDDCDGATDEDWPDKGSVCSVSAGACVASGTKVCQPNDPAGPTVCNATAGDGSLEVCDGVDNDCDGLTDEEWPEKGTICTVGLGMCLATGINVCNTADPAGSVVCGAQARPASAEVCDGADNDCDGATDEAWLDKGAICTVGTGVCRATGVRECDVAHPAAATVCNVQPGPSGVEVCDGLDNNCNGTTDEASRWADKGQPCQVGVGACVRTGVKVCNQAEPGGLTMCDVAPGAAGSETCDGLDDDCDGATDEDWPDKGTVCAVGVGECATSGTKICNAAAPAGVTVCSAVPSPVGAEVCDALDNDCDGSTDEDWPTKGTVCTVGVGTCQRSGTRVCNAAAPAGPVVCGATAGMQGTETCNGLDDDCDGATDEDWADKGTVCTVGVGTCQRPGTFACNAGNPAGPVVCGVVAGAAGTDVCNGLDDDCDGATDEDWPTKGTVCSAGKGQCLRSGTLACDAANPAGPVVCGATPGAALTEVCDALDNDCDGDTDEDWPSLGQVCYEGLGLCRTAGVVVCDAVDPSTARCTAEPPDGEPEDCDGLDNDCDGATDEGLADLPCQSENPIGVCLGTATCGHAFGWICDAPMAALEACDGFDNDCDGATDEDFLDGDGRYAFDQNCGRCGNNCTLLFLGGTTGICNTAFEPFRCGPQCLPGFFDLDDNPNDCECEYASAVDFPDPGGVDANCDGIDGELDNGVFVARFGDDANPGTLEAPKRTVQAGIDVAAAQGKRDVYVTTGVYAESVALEAGVSVYGGYGATWRVRSTALYESALLPAAVGSAGPGAVNAIGLVGAAGTTVFDGFSVFAPDALAASASTYGIYVRDCDDLLRVSNNIVHGGIGGKGGRGDDGDDGDDGTNGGGGTAAFDLYFYFKALNPAYEVDHCVNIPSGQVAPVSAGGAGGQFSCGATSVSGGAGGLRICPAVIKNTDQTVAPTTAERGSAGVNNGTPGGAGGSAGQDVYHQSYSCDGYSSYGAVEGGNGADGTDGTSGGSGTGCEAPGGAVSGSGWVPGVGTSGSGGTSGGGAGGGGSGGGAYVHTSCFSKGFGYDNYGGSGGGGGSGACEGTAGSFGTSGGGSFAVFVVFSSTPSSVPTLASNAISRGYGGDGGDGGNGGVGGAGGLGGAGGAGGGGYNPVDPTYPAFKGGKGGQGGQGGHGGGGGGGCGGPAYGIFATGVDAGSLAPWKFGNTFVAGGEGGDGGRGGFSLGNPGTPGATGANADANF